MVSSLNEPTRYMVGTDCFSSLKCETDTMLVYITYCNDLIIQTHTNTIAPKSVLEPYPSLCPRTSSFHHYIMQILRSNILCYFLFVTGHKRTRARNENPNIIALQRSNIQCVSLNRSLVKDSVGSLHIPYNGPGVSLYLLHEDTGHP